MDNFNCQEFKTRLKNLIEQGKKDVARFEYNNLSPADRLKLDTSLGVYQNIK